MSDGFKSNANFFKLSFLDKNNVRLGKNFKELLPVLWMKSGSVGECPVIDDDNIDMLVLPKNKMAVLLNEDSYAKFISKINKEDIKTIFFVTDFEPNFISMASNFKECDCYQLYRDYLDNFSINVRRS
jgi:adenine-specific DNA-methyltransferase